MSKILAVKSTTQNYTADELPQFTRYLEEIDEHTTRIPIRSHTQLELDASGCLKESGFAMSPLALQQLCKLISKGLWPLVADIGGILISPQSNGVISVPSAALILNSCVQLRFRVPGGPCGMDLMQNHKTKVIDGIVGPRYKYLPNHHLLALVDEILRDNVPAMSFTSGSLTGRRLAATFLSPTVVGHLGGLPICGGCYFTNSEVGECGVRGGPIMQLVGSNQRMLVSLKHIAHKGEAFTQRLHGLFGEVLEGWDTLLATAKRADTLGSKSLDVTAAAERKLDTRKRKRLETQLSQHLDRKLAEDIVRKAIFVGADGDAVPAKVQFADIAQRDVRDLVVTLMKAAEGQYHTIREDLERAAFEMLTKVKT